MLQVSPVDSAYPRLQGWISEHLGRSGARVARELSGGNSNVTLFVESDQGPLVLRTPPADTISPTAHRGVEREFRIMSALQGHAPVPRVLGWCGDSEIIGRPFVLVEYIDGLSITAQLPPAYNGVSAVNRLGEHPADALVAPDISLPVPLAPG